MKLPESAVSGTKNSEETLIKRLDEFRKINTDEITVLNYFDEMEITPVVINAEISESQIDGAIEKMMQIIGMPRNYGPTPEMLAEEKSALEGKRLHFEEIAAHERTKRESEEFERHQKAVAEWVLYVLCRMLKSKR